MVDIAVIGLGMIGSAALRYLSRPETGLQVLGIGPDEPPEWATHNGAFASHYDQARITRVTDPDLIWATLAQRSIQSYPEIEQLSGIRFHHPTGHLRVTPQPDSTHDLLATAETIGRTLNAPIEQFDRSLLTTQFPYLWFSDQAQGIYERGGAGWINPHALVRAQLSIAAKQGAAIARAEAHQLVRTSQGFTITTSQAETFEARRVLLSVHGYTNMLIQPLLGRALDLVNMAHTTVYAHIPAEQAERLAGMPSLIWALEGHPVLKSVYTTPPATTPDGQIRLKIGGPLWNDLILETPEAITAWFQGQGNPAEVTALEGVLEAIVPGLVAHRWSAKPCMNTYTSHGYPYVDQLDNGIFICTGGCGSAAKSSDEIGRMGALLAQHSNWTYDLPADTFRAVDRQ